MEILKDKPNADKEFVAIFDHPDNTALELSEPLRHAFPNGVQSRGISVTLIIPFQEPSVPVFCAEAKPEQGVAAVSELLEVANQPEFRHSYDTFVDARRTALANDLGVCAGRLMFMENHGVIRMKSGNQGKTRAHIDYYSYMFKTDTLAEISLARFGEGDFCTVCGTPIEIGPKRSVWMDAESRPINIRSPRVCKSCADAPLQVFTIWSCLHEMSTTADAVLEADPRPLEVNPFDLSMNEILRETPLWLLDHEEWTSFDGPGLALAELKPGQGMVFTPRIPHRSRGGQSGDLRISLDIRFALRPAIECQVSS